MYKLVIPGRLPGMNEYTAAQRANKFEGAKMKRNNQESIEWLIKSQLKGVSITNPVVIHYFYFEPNFKRDVDNIHGFAAKVINDALVAQKVIQDDNQKCIKGFFVLFSYDKDNPRIEVLIEEKGEGSRNE